MRFGVGFGLGVLVAALIVALFRPWAASEAGMRFLGHYRYPVANAKDLQAVDAKGEILLQPSAARAFKAMRLRAWEEGIQIVPVSGYRDLQHQHRLFFDVAAEHGETLKERARTCAPPGFSEHHTGFSLDLGDGAHLETQLDAKFRDTAAYQWMRANGPRFHFEMSFPKNNQQHLAFEPWHWRFVGDLQSFRTFYYARFSKASAPKLSSH